MTFSRRVCLTTAILLGFCLPVRAELDISGVWNATASMEDNEREITWTFKRDGGKFSGTSKDHENGDVRKIDRITVKENKLVLEIDMEQDGNTGVIKVIATETARGKLKGEWSLVGTDGTEYLSGDVVASKEVSFAGDWKTTAELPDGAELESVLKIKGENAKLDGVLVPENRDDIKIDKLTAKDGGLRCEFDFEMEGSTLEVVIESKLKGHDKLTGKWSVGDGEAEGDWSAVRVVDRFAGEWSVSAKVPDSDDYSGTLVLRQEQGEYVGTSKPSDGKAIELQNVKVDGRQLQFAFPYDRDGYTGTIKVTAKHKNGALNGEWSFGDGDGNEYASDEWTATKK